MTLLHPSTLAIRLLRARFVRVVFVGSMLAGTAFMAWSSFAYFFGDEFHPFIDEKLPLPLEDVWLAALNIHVVTALFSLPACVFLLSRTVIKRLPRLHRHLGRITGVVVLFAMVPSGAYLALFAKGGIVVTVGFISSALVVVIGMIRGTITARRGEIAHHRNAMAHVTAQLSVAVTSRAMLLGLDAARIDEGTAYVLALWIPVVASAALVEFIAPRPRSRSHALVERPLADTWSQHALSQNEQEDSPRPRLVLDAARPLRIGGH